jgi:formate hydrogenlyase subunit 3/multisubunit Na+/H+ antiporter MnhD subunit
MADEVGPNVHFRGAGRQWYLLLIVTALLVLAVLGVLAARALRPVLAYKYVSRINQGQVQVCRVTPAGGVICPPLSSSLSKSKSYSPSKSLSTSTSLSPSVRAQ